MSIGRHFEKKNNLENAGRVSYLKNSFENRSRSGDPAPHFDSSLTYYNRPTRYHFAFDSPVDVGEELGVLGAAHHSLEARVHHLSGPRRLETRVSLRSARAFVLNNFDCVQRQLEGRNEAPVKRRDPKTYQ